MKRDMKRLVALALAGTMALSLAGCGGGGTQSSDNGGQAAATTAAGSDSAAEAPAAAKPVSTFTVEVPEGESVSQQTDVVGATSVDFTTMDPMDTSDTLSGGLQRLIMDGFFGFNDDMEIIPMLAESYEANDDATEYTLHIRQGITFSDGTPMDAAAAKANLDRWGDKELGLKRTTLLCNVIDHTDIVDDYTVKVTLSQPFGAFIATLAHPACVLMSPEVIAQGNEACASSPVGTGQYLFKEWVAGDHATVTLNPDWWGYDAEICGGTALAEPDAGFKSITFRPVAENATRVAMLQAGDADFIWPVPSESMATLAADPNVCVNAEESIVVRYIFMNNQKEPYTDKRVRQAMNYAINRDAYIQVVKNGLATKATSVMGPAVQHYKANDPYPYDPEKAKELLAEAGYPDGFETTLTCASTTANLKQAEFIQQQLAQVGIKVNINALESAVVNEMIQDTDAPGAEAEVELYTIGWSSSTGDADWSLRPLLAIESEPPMSYNICYYENPDFDNLLYEALSTADESIRAEKYAEAQDIAWEDCPMVCLVNDDNTWGTSNKIANVKNYADGCLNIRNARMLAE